MFMRDGAASSLTFTPAGHFWGTCIRWATVECTPSFPPERVYKLDLLRMALTEIADFPNPNTNEGVPKRTTEGSIHSSEVSYRQRKFILEWVNQSPPPSFQAEQYRSHGSSDLIRLYGQESGPQHYLKAEGEPPPDSPLKINLIVVTSRIFAQSQSMLESRRRRTS
ncbi:hypothetical protein JR316_0008866 [Psilocybe cubensis]|uniref:Uncharacterized protein n=1 Tax=Psilocybe cubensis TaxID=181762 RepID=A0ACB8GS72_PSICU|nr:hypothetical protein JR316_0008866 [Psilocybe cubensis]KAH9478411.1 hypothetical protein JR316_0008866 [Psilocybe cubensis]